MRRGLATALLLMGAGTLATLSRPAAAQSGIALPNVTVQAEAGRDGATVNFSLPGTANGVPLACTYGSGSFFPIGKTTVSCQAEGPSGKTVGSFTVTVVGGDRQPPAIGGHGYVRIAATPGEVGAAVAFALPGAVDDGRSVPVSCAPASGSYFLAGSTIVTCTAIDAAGNSAQTKFEVFVVGSGSSTTQPVAPVAPRSTSSLPPGVCFPCVTTTTTSTTTTLPPTTLPPTTAPITVSPLLGRSDEVAAAAPARPPRPDSGGGFSPAIAAIGSLAALGALMGFALIARWRFERH